MDAQYYSGWGHLGLRGGRGETLAQQYAMGGGVVATIVLSWGNGCTTSNPWGFAACRNASNQNSSSALMKPWGFMGCMHG